MPSPERHHAYIREASFEDEKRKNEFAARIKTLCKYILRLAGKLDMHQRSGAHATTFTPPDSVLDLVKRYPEYASNWRDIFAIPKPEEEWLDEQERDILDTHRIKAQHHFIDGIRGLVSRHQEKLHQLFEKELDVVSKDMIPFFEMLITEHPLQGIMIFHEYANRKYRKDHGGGDKGRIHEQKLAEKHVKGEHDVSGEWFLDTIESGQRITQDILNFFDTWKARCAKDMDGARAQEFLEHWKQEEFLKINEYMMYATQQVFNARARNQVEECTPIAALLPAEVPRSEINIARNRVKKLFASAQDEGVEKTWYQGIDEEIGILKILADIDPSSRLVLVPTLASVLDIRGALGHIQKYWEELSLALNLTSEYTVRKREDIVNVKIADIITFDFRGTPVLENERVTKQARIRIRGKGPLEHLSKRVDLDDDGLTLDDGGVHFYEAYAYAKRVRQQDIENRKASKEWWKRHKGDKPVFHFHPSIMESDARLEDGKSLSPENKIALFSTIIMQAGYEMGLRSWFTFSNHSREFISDQDHSEHFAEIVDALLESLQRNPLDRG